MDAGGYPAAAVSGQTTWDRTIIRSRQGYGYKPKQGDFGTADQELRQGKQVRRGSSRVRPGLNVPVSRVTMATYFTGDATPCPAGATRAAITE